MPPSQLARLVAVRSVMAWRLRRTALRCRGGHGRDAGVKIGDFLDQLIKARRYGFYQRQRRERGQDHLAVPRGLALITEADCAVRPIKLREHEVMTERVRMTALG